MDYFPPLISQALAQDAIAPAAANPAAGLMNLLPFALIFGVFYLLVIRPQQKKLDEQGKMIKALQRGNRVVTNGGLHGKVVRLEGDSQLILEIADGVQIKHERSQIQNLAAKTQPVDVIEAEKK